MCCQLVISTMSQRKSLIKFIKSTSMNSLNINSRKKRDVLTYMKGKKWVTTNVYSIANILEERNYLTSSI